MHITRREAGDWTELLIEGRLDGYWAEHLETGLADAVRGGHHRLRLDLSAVPFLSSAGIAVLVKFYKRLNAIHGALVVTAASPQVRTVLDMTRLTAMLVAAPEAAAPPTLTLGSAFVSRGVVCELFELDPAARMRCRGFAGSTPGRVARPAPVVPGIDDGPRHRCVRRRGRGDARRVPRGGRRRRLCPRRRHRGARLPRRLAVGGAGGAGDAVPRLRGCVRAALPLRRIARGYADPALPPRRALPGIRRRRGRRRGRGDGDERPRRRRAEACAGRRRRSLRVPGRYGRG